MNAPAWKSVASALCAAAIGASAAFAFGPGGGQPPSATPVAAAGGVDNPAPPAKDKPPGEWIPKLVLVEGVLDDLPRSIAWVPSPPSAFPELKLPDPAVERYETAMSRVCARVLGKTPLVIAPGDGTAEKLLKARLQRGIFQWVRHRELLRCGALNTGYAAEIVEGLTDMAAVCQELWGGQPKELLPWLEELVIAAKEFELFQTARALRENSPPVRVDLAVRHRLAAELTLWKAKNRK
jgi:hypothetical protein